MSKRESYAPGTPCWVDLACVDIDASASFYEGLLGWQAGEMPNSAEMGGYRRAGYEGEDVAGLMPRMQADQPQMWATYVSVADAEATAAKVSAAGGAVLAPPMDVMDLGRMAIFTDPTGAVFGVWQPGTFAGAGRVNEAGALCWNELGTRDVEAAKAFYGEVFGWTAREHELQRADGGPGPAIYVEWQLDGDSIGGMMDISGMLPEEVPAHWLVYFGVEDTDAAVEKVKAAGGDVRFGPVDIDAGRFAVVTEPNADPGVFAVIQLPG
ncbi:MAG TPA: VOC family protein [Solirubrobacterales bacterium]|nr:VOC family protein [Solirubrobacterales bacterium]